MKLTQSRRQKIVKTLNKYRIIDEKGCFGWKGATREGSSPSIYVEGTPIGAHRCTWMVEKGKIPYGHYVLHKCNNKACTKVEHLYLSNKRGPKVTKTMIKRPGVARLAMNIPIYLMTSIKEMAQKYNQTITQFVIKRLTEVIVFEKNVDKGHFSKKKQPK